MNRLATNTVIAAYLALAAAACASGPRPEALDQASAMLDGKRAAEFASMQPKLMAEAREELALAEAAYERGDMEEASLRARMAMQRYETAKNFQSRSSSRATARAMTEARDGAAADRARAEAASAAELRKLKGFEERLGRAEASNKGSVNASGDAAGAKRAILDARDQQAEAIRSGAPTAASEPYAEGVSQIEAALEALELGMADRARSSASRASTIFAAATASARIKPTTVAAAPREANEAQFAVQRAEDARADAVARVGASHPDLARGDALLDGARRAAADKSPQRAVDGARDARRVFAQIVTGPARAATGSTDSLTQLAERLIVDLQFRRGELLGQGKPETCRGPFREFDAVLELAQKRFDARDYGRAYEFAIRAGERLRVCDPGAPTSATAANAALDPKKVRAASAIQRAQADLANVRATLVGDDRLKGPEGLVASADQWFERSSYAQAEALAKQASTILAGLKVSAPSPKNGHAEASQASALTVLSQAQTLYAQVAGKLGDDDSRLRKAKELLASADRWFDRSAYDASKSFAEKAIVELRALEKKEAQPKAGDKATCTNERDALTNARASAKAVDDTKLGAPQKSVKAQAGRLFVEADAELNRGACDKGKALVARADALVAVIASPTAKTDAPTTPHVGKFAEGTKAHASERIAEAEAARDRARPLVRTETRAAFSRGEASLATSKTEAAASRHQRAADAAGVAISHFEAVTGAASPAAASASPATPTTPRSAPPKRAVAARPAWAPGYDTVVAALGMRDRVAAKGTPEAKAAIARGAPHLAQARSAWSSGAHAEAEAQARAAMAIYAGASTTPSAKAASSTTSDFRHADEALREARVALDLCMREACAERDASELARAKATVESAMQALDASRFGYSIELSHEAKEKLAELLGKPRPADPVEDPSKRQQREAEAEAELREATLAFELCKRRDCARSDIEGQLRGSQLLDAARAAMLKGRFTQAKDLAAKARVSLRGALGATPTFMIPDGVTMVTANGDRLVVRPAIQFTLGSTTIAPASLPAVKELAAVISANSAALENVTLVGYTDNQGADAKNRTISGARARAVVDALVRAGAPGGVLASDGRGPDDPISDNTTAAGRAANRRVEVLISRKGEK